LGGIENLILRVSGILGERGKRSKEKYGGENLKN